MGWCDVILMKDVKDAKTFATFATQTTGMPYPSHQMLGKTNKLAKEIFEAYPCVTWETLCKVVLWSKDKKRRFASVYNCLNSYRYAYADGWLPEMDIDVATKIMDERIAGALRVEKDPEWLRRLVEARGPYREKIYKSWESHRHLVDL